LIKVDGTNLAVKAYTEDNTGSGYLYFTPEQYCFGDYVYVILQPNNAYYDFNRLGETSDPGKMTKIWKSDFGTRYLIPAEYDIYVSFSPSKDDSNLNAEAQAACSKGAFKLWAQHVTDSEALTLKDSTATPYANSANANDDTKAIMLKDIIQYVERLVIESDVSAYVEPTVVDSSTPEEELLAEPIPADKLPDQPISSDGTTPVWYETIYNEKVLFSVGGTEITAK
jgi:hypothetical protein